jgi:hypothetical protein
MVAATAATKADQGAGGQPNRVPGFVVIIIVCSVVGVILIAAAIFFYYRRRNARRLVEQEDGPGEAIELEDLPAPPSGVYRKFPFFSCDLFRQTTIRVPIKSRRKSVANVTNRIEQSRLLGRTPPSSPDSNSLQYRTELSSALTDRLDGSATSPKPRQRLGRGRSSGPRSPFFSSVPHNFSPPTPILAGSFSSDADSAKPVPPTRNDLHRSQRRRPPPWSGSAPRRRDHHLRAIPCVWTWHPDDARTPGYRRPGPGGRGERRQQRQQPQRVCRLLSVSHQHH